MCPNLNRLATEDGQRVRQKKAKAWQRNYSLRIRCLGRNSSEIKVHLVSSVTGSGRGGVWNGGRGWGCDMGGHSLCWGQTLRTIACIRVCAVVINAWTGSVAYDDETLSAKMANKTPIVRIRVSNEILYPCPTINASHLEFSSGRQIPNALRSATNCNFNFDKRSLVQKSKKKGK